MYCRSSAFFHSDIVRLSSTAQNAEGSNGFNLYKHGPKSVLKSRGICRVVPLVWVSNLECRHACHIQLLVRLAKFSTLQLEFYPKLYRKRAFSTKLLRERRRRLHHHYSFLTRLASTWDKFKHSVSGPRVCPLFLVSVHENTATGSRKRGPIMPDRALSAATMGGRTRRSWDRRM